MAENPLLPNDQLRALYAQTRRAVALEAKRARSQSSRSGAQASRAALAAACILQLEPSDLLLCDPLDATLQALAPASRPSGWPSFPGKQSPMLLAAAALACGLRAAHSNSLVLVSLRAAAEQSDWRPALEWAQGGQLPLIVVCGDESGFSPAPISSSRQPSLDALTWPNVRKQTNLLQLPVLTVDGEDAVAVYRCMQESVLRARAGGGPAMLWATLPSPRELRKPRPPAQEPLGRLRDYLRSRKIALRAP